MTTDTTCLHYVSTNGTDSVFYGGWGGYVESATIVNVRYSIHYNKK